MAVYRLTTPLTRDRTAKKPIHHLQREINARLRNHGSSLRCDVDGEYGPETAACEAHAAWLLGASHPHDHKRAQAIILRPAIRTPREFLWGRRHTRIEKRRKGTGAAGAVKLALELAHHRPPYTEHPAGSNTDGGGIIDRAQAECGMHGQFYCGAGVHYMVLHGGGVKLSAGVVYCPTIEALARSGQGGFKEWITAPSKWRAGDVLTFDEGGVAGHTELATGPVKDGMIPTVGWNTSSGDGGSQSNGGGIFPRLRPVHGSFPVRGAARPRYAS